PQLGPGDSFGWEAMWVQGRSPASLFAESDARLLVMGHAQFRAVKALAAPRLTPDREGVARAAVRS
ncbi:MAG: hypothetical protein M3024_08425, partial [Candidatus Dormibacteraeota bacterium]|nr:hypothetical protein [Candidatus Dormibacteraeota bacterium]